MGIIFTPLAGEKGRSAACPMTPQVWGSHHWDGVSPPAGPLGMGRELPDPGPILSNTQCVRKGRNSGALIRVFITISRFQVQIPSWDIGLFAALGDG